MANSCWGFLPAHRKQSLQLGGLGEGSVVASILASQALRVPSEAKAEGQRRPLSGAAALPAPGKGDFLHHALAMALPQDPRRSVHFPQTVSVTRRAVNAQINFLSILHRDSNNYCPIFSTPPSSPFLQMSLPANASICSIGHRVGLMV